jgi:hypothetical protein
MCKVLQQEGKKIALGAPANYLERPYFMRAENGGLEAEKLTFPFFSD